MDPLHRICFASLLILPMVVTAADSAATSTSKPATAQAQPSGSASAPAAAGQSGGTAAANANPAPVQKPISKNPLNAMTPEQEFAKLDSDGNGKITAKEAEADENLVDHFEKVAQDDTVDKTEYLAWLNSGTAGMSHNWPMLNNTSGKPSYEDELPPARRTQPMSPDPNMSNPAQPASAE